ncbi:NAD(P)-binding protein [Periconia macrospinosa]|uniref:NAD(P)-binding protein n=1 Tax=Periconia macrospinosa TaxID=97972 RepID=A0A2V1DG32_9PLEO|nr:NAD(P)-binding protein [Periconia macrospinosa]
MPFDINTTDTEVISSFGKEAQDKTVLITGPSIASIGSQVAISLATAGPKLLILAGRNKEKITPVIEEIKKANAEVPVKFVQLDLLSHKSVRDCVKQVKEITDHIDAIINNAGVMATRKFTLSEDNVESQFAVNYLSHFLLTNLLLREGLIKSGGLILNVGSLGYQMADIQLNDINYSNGQSYNGWKAYGQAKSAQILGTRGLANRLKGKGIAVLVAHPGVTLESSLLANSAIDQEYFGEAYALAIERNDGKPLPPQNMVSLKQAAGVLLYTALNPEFRSKPAAFIVENEVYTLTREYVNNDTDADKLWELSEKLVGEKFTF